MGPIPFTSDLHDIPNEGKVNKGEALGAGEHGGEDQLETNRLQSRFWIFDWENI